MRRASLYVAAGLIALLTLAALRALSGSDGSDSSSQPESAQAGVVDDTDGPGPMANRYGVPQGWTHDAAGARSAAVTAVSLTGEIAKAGFITRRDMITSLATSTYGPSLAAASTDQLDQLIDGTDIAAEEIVLDELPLSARVLRSDDRAARVEVWSVVIVGASSLGAPRQLWHTVVVDLAWERDDWRVARWAMHPGPTPSPPVDALVSSMDEIAVVMSWPKIGGR
jgi:hypothetical protein